MECNKDDAAKAKEIAEKKLKEKDLIGANKFASKAQSLYPGLDGLEQLVVTVNVYIAAEKKINGVVDWYGLLGVDKSCDDEAVKKQYRKLALILHPDKNKSVGAEGAFKLLSEAWSLLSDKAKRATYDLRIKAYDQHTTSASKLYKKKIPTPPSKPMGRDGLHPSPHIYNASRNVPNPHLAPSKRSNTFWTVCTNCKMQFEYVLHYLNKRLQCYSCKKPFLAISTSPPQTKANGSVVYSGDVGSIPAYSSASNLRTNAHVSEALEGEIQNRTSVKRPNGGEASGSCSVMKTEKQRKRRHLNGLKIESSGVGTVSGNIETDKVTNVGSKLLPSMRELSLQETRNMIMNKARRDICKKLDEWKNLPVKPNTSNKAACLKKKEKSKVNADSNGSTAKCLDEKLSTISDRNSTDSEAQASDVDMFVPDSDFYDFDKGRAENSFGDNQVWAAYDNDDGMPRYYAMIHNVLSRRPFKMRISWLNSKITSEFGNLNWTGCGFYKTSGDFRVGKHELNKNVNSFSHQVKWAKGPRGAIRVLPSKGDVWALYKNWSSDWDEHTPDETIHQYEMVQVLADYDEEKGATVVPLVKVAGFKTVFHKHVDEKEVKIIPREEMFRFSHQVPSYLLTGEESPKAPKGCLELDPAAIPTELLQVTTETSENVPKENIEEVERNDLPEGKNKNSQVDEKVKDLPEGKSSEVTTVKVKVEEVARESPSEIMKTQVKCEIASEIKMENGISTVG